MIQTIDAALFKSMILSGAALLDESKQAINDLNVFPVPDGDTGTNMSLTLSAGVNALNASSFSSVSDVANTAADALLRGARGNSGVILSLLFRGMSKALKDHTEIDTAVFASALSEGVSAAYKAVMRPTEGTILTVSRIIAEKAAEYSVEGNDFSELFNIVIEAGEDALKKTTDQNPVLKKAGVVDAGGKGYMCLITGMMLALNGEAVSPGRTGEASEKANPFTVFDDDDITFTYCTEFIVNRENLQSPEVLRDWLGDIGDSLVFVEDDEIIKVHVHTDVPGKVLTKALTYGSFVTVKVENMRLQHTEMANMPSVSDAAPSEPFSDEEAAPENKYGTVAVCAGEGMQEVFKNLGVDAIVTGGQTMNPSTEDILKAVRSVPAETVFVLPNNKNIIMAAQQCAPLTDKNVIVISSKTVPQGVSAMLSFDESVDEETLTRDMEDACGLVRTALITYAARDSEFDGHSIKAGEYLALIDGALIGNDSDLARLLSQVSAAFLSRIPDVITVYYGEDVSQEAASTVGSKLSDTFPDSDVTVINGGQPVYYYMISAE